MILIIGGAASGKREYARSLGYKDDEISNVREMLCAGQDPEALRQKLYAMPVVIYDEVGSGVVPVSRNERAQREECGRLCIELAAHAERVVRMFCGIATIIKA